MLLMGPQDKVKWECNFLGSVVVDFRVLIGGLAVAMQGLRARCESGVGR